MQKGGQSGRAGRGRLGANMLHRSRCHQSMVCNVIMVFSNILSPALYWGSASDGSLVFLDDPNVLQDGCDESFAPFPPGKVQILVFLVCTTGFARK